MKARLFRVVTFSTEPEHGNPAFVLTNADGASDRALVGACAMLGADIIAVVGGEAGGEIPLKFFTQAGPHPGAGHATLAAAHVALLGGFDTRENRTGCVFRQVNGEARPGRVEGSRISVDFPVMPGVNTDRAAELAAALGASPHEVLVAPFAYVAVFEDSASVAALLPDLALISGFDRNAVVATAPGKGDCDIVIRVFAPKVGLPEDPVCGTAHRIIIPYWAEKLGKKKIRSRQLSPRGGTLWCEDKGDQIAIAGETCLVLEGTVRLPD
ncbi:MAG TPA: PhzF family phenazine biosynthesis protein [Rhizomicrobium sp.]|nr:PhzF family phenazine biosynthesis protein [Rhizomicrobium sp.]